MKFEELADQLGFESDEDRQMWMQQYDNRQRRELLKHMSLLLSDSAGTDMVGSLEVLSKFAIDETLSVDMAVGKSSLGVLLSLLAKLGIDKSWSCEFLKSGGDVALASALRDCVIGVQFLSRSSSPGAAHRRKRKILVRSLQLLVTSVQAVSLHGSSPLRKLVACKQQKHALASLLLALEFLSRDADATLAVYQVLYAVALMDRGRHCQRIVLAMCAHKYSRPRLYEKQFALLNSHAQIALANLQLVNELLGEIDVNFRRKLRHTWLAGDAFDAAAARDTFPETPDLHAELALYERSRNQDIATYLPAAFDALRRSVRRRNVAAVERELLAALQRMIDTCNDDSIDIVPLFESICQEEQKGDNDQDEQTDEKDQDEQTDDNDQDEQTDDNDQDEQTDEKDDKDQDDKDDDDVMPPPPPPVAPVNVIPPPPSAIVVTNPYFRESKKALLGRFRPVPLRSDRDTVFAARGKRAPAIGSVRKMHSELEHRFAVPKTKPPAAVRKSGDDAARKLANVLRGGAASSSNAAPCNSSSSFTPLVLPAMLDIAMTVAVRSLPADKKATLMRAVDGSADATLLEELLSLWPSDRKAYDYRQYLVKLRSYPDDKVAKAKPLIQWMYASQRYLVRPREKLVEALWALDVPMVTGRADAIGRRLLKFADVLRNDNMATLFQTALAISNAYTNRPTAMDAFALRTLTSFANTPSPDDPKFTLLHFLVSVLREHSPDALDIVALLDRIDFDALISEQDVFGQALTDCTKHRTALAVELAACTAEAKPNRHTKAFVKQYTPLFDTLGATVDRYRNIARQWTECKQFFGHTSSDPPFLQFWQHFAVQLRNAVKFEAAAEAPTSGGSSDDDHVSPPSRLATTIRRFVHRRSPSSAQAHSNLE
jgi:hypothetical protein